MLRDGGPSDVADFCRRYPSFDAAGRTRFWVELVAAMSALESGHDPARTHRERFTDRNGRPVVSRGLLQLSIESARGYGCELESSELLHLPEHNLRCGVRILAALVERDGRIAGRRDGAWQGGARYWAVLRPPKLARIQAQLRRRAECDPSPGAY